MKKKTEKKQMRFMILACLATLLTVSVVINMVQVISYVSLEASTNQDRIALNNYRELQSRQIDTVKTFCNQSTGMENSTRFKQLASAVVRIGNYYTYSPRDKMLDDLLYGFMNAWCFTPMLTLMGKKDLSNQHLEIFVDTGNFGFDEKYFERVKW